MDQATGIYNQNNLVLVPAQVNRKGCNRKGIRHEILGVPVDLVICS